MGRFDDFEELCHLGLGERSERFGDFANEVFYVVLLETALDHC